MMKGPCSLPCARPAPFRAMVSMVTCELNHKLGLIYVYIEIGLKHERPPIYTVWILKKGLDLRKCDAVTDAL